MVRVKPCILVLGNIWNPMGFFRTMLEKEIGLETKMSMFELKGRDRCDLEKPEHAENVSCILIMSSANDELTMDEVGHICLYFHTFYPDVPIIWSHGDLNEDFCDEEWKNVTWCDDSDLSQLLKLINKAVS